MAKRNLKSEAAVIMQKKPEQVTKKDKKTLLERMRQISGVRKDRKTVQNTIPYIQMFKDGICQVSETVYSKTIQFNDVNYELADFEEKNRIFSRYCDMLNFFDNSVKFQLTFENQNREKDTLVKSIQIDPQNDDFDEIRQEYSDMLTAKILNGTNGQSCRKFITFAVDADSYKAAKAKLIGISTEIVKLLKAVGVEAQILNGKERLETLYYSLNPFRKDPFIFDWNSMICAGTDTKDYIAPSTMNFQKSKFEIGNAWGSVHTINILAGELPDTVLSDFMKSQNLFCMNIHAEPLDQITALKFVKRKLTNVEQMKIDEQKKASQSGYDPNILPPAIKMYIDDIEKLLEDLSQKNERLFHISITLRNYAKSKNELDIQLDLLKRICQKNNCMLMQCGYLQEQGLATTLPLGINDIPVSREMHTSGVAVFVPFTTRELFQPDGTYYGVNKISGNIIMADRSSLKNPNGLILGVPGSGKSFSGKREILDGFLKTTDDIIICDPEGEYYPLVSKLNGQLIKIAANSTQYINPMDINFDADMDENPISMKSEFIISLCELIVGGKYGLEADERSVIDKCVRNIYLNFLKNDPSEEKMPTLTDLYNELLMQGDIACRVANSLEMYVTGSQNLFNHRTNINLHNRVVCFDIKELGSQLKKVGMLIVQDAVWNRVSSNRVKKKITRYYIDEFHLLLKEEQTAKYSVEIWKRFRKWGGVPTGITQNVKDLLSSQEIENIFDNTDFVYMLAQAPGDREILASKLGISEEQMQYVTSSGQGEGLIRYDNIILPFVDDFPTDTMMYQLMTTKLEEQVSI